MLDWIKQHRGLSAGGTIVILTIILRLFGIFEYLSNWGVLSWLWRLIGNLFYLIAPQRVALSLLLFAIFLVLFHRRLRDVEKEVVGTFEDDFRKDLKENWDFQGDWKLAPGGWLVATDSGYGGITRVGHFWTDYSFEFTAEMIKDAVGWIVRAQDPFNYCMMQLTETKLRPHLFVNGMHCLLKEIELEQTVKPNQPLEIRTEVRGREISVFLNDKKIFYDNDFFKMRFLAGTVDKYGYSLMIVEEPSGSNQYMLSQAYTTGRVGFRECGQEKARFSNCHV